MSRSPIGATEWWFLAGAKQGGASTTYTWALDELIARRLQVLGHPSTNGYSMGRLILTMHVSADGYIAQPDGGLGPEFGWPPVVQGRLNEIYQHAGLVVYGRGIYDG